MVLRRQELTAEADEDEAEAEAKAKAEAEAEADEPEQLQAAHDACLRAMSGVLPGPMLAKEVALVRQSSHGHHQGAEKASTHSRSRPMQTPTARHALRCRRLQEGSTRLRRKTYLHLRPVQCLHDCRGWACSTFRPESWARTRLSQGQQEQARTDGYSLASSVLGRQLQDWERPSCITLAETHLRSCWSLRRAE